MQLLLVDDHAVVRRGVKSILEEEIPGVGVVEAANGDQALAALAGGPFDAVVLDLSMPGRSGLDLLAEVVERYPAVPVLIMSLHGEEQFAVRAIRVGAAGYLVKASAPAALVTAVQTVVRGERYLSAPLAARLAAEGNRVPAEPHERLSDRELDVMRLLSGGTSVSQIAAQMQLSVKTVSTYRTRLLEKLGMTNNAELTRYALERGLL